MKIKHAYTLGEMEDLGHGSRSYLYKEISAGRLKATKRGRRTIVLEPNRQAWLASLPTFKPRSTQREAETSADD